MLEYLLLRPKDMDLFGGETGQHWTFMVVDEAHTYSGAAGMEVGMLLRRLKDRVVQSHAGAIRCIGTSATLGRGRMDFPDVVQFASTLFGEIFEWVDGDASRQDVVEAEFEPQGNWDTPWGQPERGIYQTLNRNHDDIQAMAEAARTVGVPDEVVSGAQAAAANDAAAFLFHLLQKDRRAYTLRGLVQQVALPVKKACAEIFGEDGQDALEDFVALVSLCARARPKEDATPLIPARYHLFARALEGAFVTFHDRGAPRMHLEPLSFVKDGKQSRRAVELATCSRCGQGFLVGHVAVEPAPSVAEDYAGERLLRIPDRRAAQEAQYRKRFFTWDLTGAPQSDEDEAALAEGDPMLPDFAPWVFCTACGAIMPGHDGPPCGCGAEFQKSIFEVPMKDGRLATCPACGARTRFEDVAHQIMTGQDAPVAVLGSSLYQLLPPDPKSTAPGKGRKLLVFADSRQDAAYFAPYLERTHAGLLQRRLIAEALHRHEKAFGSDPARPHGLAETLLLDLTRDLGFFEGPADPARQNKARCTWVFRELLGFQRRLGLEGACLLAVRYSRPQEWTAPQLMRGDPWNLEEDEVWEVVEVLLDTLRLSGVVSIEPADITGPEFEPRNRPVYCREKGSENRHGITVLSWLPQRDYREHVTNRRFDFLRRLLGKRANARIDESVAADHVMKALKELWRSLTETPLLKSVILRDERLGVAHHIDPTWFELRHGLSADVDWKRCNICNTFATVGRSGVCPSMGCEGEMAFFDPDRELSGHHYRFLYQKMEPIPMRVREHTAQWSPRKAAEVQQEFVDGKVNILSCSTTFELGVDVGELQAVLMRNVPPSTARYIQRAGRAGRRTSATAFSLTYAQRRPHDLTHFAAPRDFISGCIKPPAVELRNPKIIRRHLYATTLALLFQQHKDRFPNVDAFFREDEKGETGPSLLARLLENKPPELVSALRRIVPVHEEVLRQLDLDNWGWVPELLDPEKGTLAIATAEIHADLAEYERLEDEAGKNRDYRRAEVFQRQANRIRRRQLLGFLAARNVLPKYGFPVDLVELHLKKSHDVAQELNLQRDLKIAVSEYAPGGQVVAGHQVWTSNGIRKLPHREAEEFAYVICSHCGRFHKRILAQDLPNICDACGEAVRGRRCRSGILLIPVFGFFSNTDPARVGASRPQRLYASRVYFSEYAGSSDGADASSGEGGAASSDVYTSFAANLTYRYARHGKLAVVNSGIGGRGFWVCQWCGHAEPATFKKTKSKKEPHGTAFGRPCNGPSEVKHLGHEFLTDVLELRFSGPRQPDTESSLWWSLTYAVLEGAAQCLGIERDDIDGCLYPYAAGGAAPAIILYDSIPGGAGHVRRIGRHVEDVLRAALNRVESCTSCNTETACYACLKTYGNQFCHDVLRRGPAAKYLRSLLTAKQ